MRQVTPMAYFINNYGISTEAIFHIDVINIKPTTEFVRVFIESDAVLSGFHDYLSLLKIDKCWVLIESGFHQFDNVLRKITNLFIK